ncbi:MAG TPA: carboxypeptidase-like regulatory domain-containing protein, partial [Fimbriimonas sp.]|nr:carboxypeptidase-like regulatory domain-containing protein [Fimbriimonas sp.]
HHRYEEKELKSPEPIKFKFHVYNEQSKDRSFEFSGKVVDANGTPIDGSAIEVMQSQSDIYRGKSKLDGSFSFRIPRMWNRDPQHSGYTVKVSKGQLMSSQYITETDFWYPVTLTLEDSQASYSGVVVDTDGKPIPNCEVIAFDFYQGQTGSTGGQSKLTDSAGRFKFDRLVPGGSIHFRVGDAGGNSPTGTVHYPKSGVQMIEAGNHDLGTITVPRAGEPVTGRLVGSNQELKPGTATILIVGENCYAHVQIDEEGNFVSQPVPNEPLSLYVFTGDKGGFRTDPNGPDLLLKRPVRSGEKVDLKVKWRPPAK